MAHQPGSWSRFLIGIIVGCCFWPQCHVLFDSLAGTSGVCWVPYLSAHVVTLGTEQAAGRTMDCTTWEVASSWKPCHQDPNVFGSDSKLGLMNTVRGGMYTYVYIYLFMLRHLQHITSLFVRAHVYEYAYMWTCKDIPTIKNLDKQMGV